MFDDHNMDKKNRSSQPLNKGNGLDSKKSQDVSTGKQVPKNSKRREPAGSSLSSKNENRMGGGGRPGAQKFRAFDKRPKPRGGYAAGGKEGPKINLYEDEPELGSLYTPGSKKQNLNHLLNFQYAAPPGHYAGNGGRNSFGGRVSSRAGSHSVDHYNFLTAYPMSFSKHKYNKEQFLQANCQFVVRASEDYGVHLGDPDQLVKWEFIEQIRGFGNEDLKCPICLDLPRATQITRCGHCFCWPCILHYLALSDKSWRKCPICYEAVHLADLKSFASVIKIPAAVNEEITFQLMKRERGSTVLAPVTQFEHFSPRTILNVSEPHLDTVYCKLLTASHEDILRIVDSEQTELECLLSELHAEQCPTLCFTERALDLLKQRKADILAKMSVAGEEMADTDRKNDNDVLPTSKTNVEEMLPNAGAGVIAEEGDAAVSNKDIGGVTGTDVDTIDNLRDTALNNNKNSGLNLSQIAELNLLETSQCSTSDHPAGEPNTRSLSQSDSGGNSDAMEALKATTTLEDHADTPVLDAIEDPTPISMANRARYESVSSEECNVHVTCRTGVTADDLDIDADEGEGRLQSSSSCSVGSNAQPQKHFYFYQAIDGQQIFLHAVNVRMLEMTYGALEHCPRLITGRILEKESGSMTEDLRRRLRYLQHLPVTCAFEVAEIELGPPLISDDTVERFRDQLASRERRRGKRAREEKRRSKRIEEVEYKQYGHPMSASTTRSRARHLRIESHFQFPECGINYHPLGGACGTPVSISTESSRASSPGASGRGRSVSPLTSSMQALCFEQQQSGVSPHASSASFAQKLRESTGDMMTTPGSGSMLWPSVGERRRTTSEASDSTMVPQYRQSFGQALLLAPPLEDDSSFHTEEDLPQTSGGNKNNNNNNKKKKRKQQTLLFTTGGIYNK